MGIRSRLRWMSTYGMRALLTLACVSAAASAAGRPQQTNSTSAPSRVEFRACNTAGHHLPAAHLRSDSSHKAGARKGLRRSSEPVKVLYDQPDLSSLPAHEGLGSRLEPHVRSLLNISLSQLSPRAPPAAATAS